MMGSKDFTNGTKKMSEKTKTVLCFLFFILTVLVRIYFEMEVFAKRSLFGYFVVVHHSCWYMFVFYYFSACNRYILGMNPAKIKYTAFLSPVIMIPVIHAAISGNKLDLGYLDGNLKDNLFHMVTLYYKHPKNGEFFIEMVVLLILFIVGSWFISKSVKKTLLNVLVGFYGCMMLAGFHFFGVAPKTRAYFKITTALKNHQLMSLIYFSFAVLFFIIYSYPEIKSYLKSEKIRWMITVCAGIFLSITVNILFFQKFYQKTPQFADYLLMLVPYSVFAAGINSMDGAVSSKFKSGRFFPLFFGFIATMIVAGIYFRI